MPNVKSAEKRMRTNAKRAARNRAARTRLRNAIKKVRQAESAEAATTAFQTATSLLDRAASSRLIHPNMAARTKSRLAAHIQRLAGAAAETA